MSEASSVSQKFEDVEEAVCSVLGSEDSLITFTVFAPDANNDVQEVRGTLTARVDSYGKLVMIDMPLETFLHSISRANSGSLAVRRCGGAHGMTQEVFGFELHPSGCVFRLSAEANRRAHRVNGRYIGDQPAVVYTLLLT